MNTKSIIRAVVFILLFAIGSSANAFVGMIAVGFGEMDENVGRIQTPFTAEASLETEDMNVNTRIYYAPGKVRDELQIEGQDMVMIRRFDLNKMWMIIGQGMYMETDPEEGSDQAPDYKLISRERLGKETVNGIEATKYKSVYESKDGKFGGFTWYTDDNIAVKAFMISEVKGEKQRVKYEFKTLERGPQADAMFEIPAGYQKLNRGGLPSLSGMKQMDPQSGDAGNSGDGSSFPEEVADDAAQEAKDATSDGIVDGIGDGVRKGIGKLFGR